MNERKVKISTTELMAQITKALGQDLIGTCQTENDMLIIHLLTGQKFAVNIKELDD